MSVLGRLTFERVNTLGTPFFTRSPDYRLAKVSWVCAIDQVRSLIVMQATEIFLNLEKRSHDELEEEEYRMLMMVYVTHCSWRRSKDVHYLLQQVLISIKYCNNFFFYHRVIYLLSVNFTTSRFVIQEYNDMKDIWQKVTSGIISWRWNQQWR